MKLVATDTPQFIPGIGEIVWQPAPSIQRMLHTPHVACAHVRFFLSDRGPSAGFTSPGLPSTCLKPRNTEIPLSPKTLSRGRARARARAKSRFLDQPYNPRMLRQESVARTNPGQSGAKPVKRPLALTSPTWVQGLSRVLWEGARPRGAENCEKQNSCFSPKPCQVVAHARAREGKIGLFDQPYNPRMLTQESVTRTNPGKAWAPLLACAASDGYEGMRSRSPIAARYGALSAAGWVQEAFRNYLAGNRGESTGNRRFNGMAGESVALNPALRERNRNLKGCGLTGLLFLGWHGPCNP